jgi:hypothetical protein
MSHLSRSDRGPARLLAPLLGLVLGGACVLPSGSEATSDLRVLSSASVLGQAVTVPERAGTGLLDDLLIDTASGTVVAAQVRGSADTPGVGLIELAALERGPAGKALVVQRADQEFLRVPDYSDLFEGRSPVPLEGEIRAIDRVGGGCSEVRLVDAGNLFHRVRIEAAALVMRRAPSLAVGQKVRFRGIETRDERGKLWIASEIDQEGTALVLRDASGALKWRGLGCVSSRELVGSIVRTADDQEAVIVDWTLDWTAAALTGLVIELGGTRHELTWAELVRADDGTWRTLLLAEELRPVVEAPQVEVAEPEA